MLKLLSTMNAAHIAYIHDKKGNYLEAFNPNKIIEIQQNKESFMAVLMYKQMLTNAIEAKELPALAKPKGKAADKKMLEKLNIPNEYINELQQYDYWITFENLFVYLEKPKPLSKDYSHGREALARIICALIVEQSDNTDNAISEYLTQKIDTAEITLKKKYRLGDSTIKSACREIIDTFSAIQGENHN